MDRPLFLVLASSLLLALAAGCSGPALGADEIARGRTLYNEVINRTNDEQVLAVIVRHRYGLSSGLLEVQGVTASLSVSTHATGQLPIGPDDLWGENLVPLEVGVAAEVSPTISYVPIRGEQAIESLLLPLPLHTVVLLARSLEETDITLSVLLESLNGLPHPASGLEGGERFARAVALLGDLQRAGHADWGASVEEGGLFLVLFGYESRREQVDELLGLLGLSPAPADGADVVLPLHLAVGSPRDDGLSVRTRSALDLLRIAAACVEVPAADRAAGLVSPLPASIEAMAGIMQVRSGPEPPDNAPVTIPHGGSWYWIEATDHTSKRFFRLVAILLELQLRAEATALPPPMLTIPVR